MRISATAEAFPSLSSPSQCHAHRTLTARIPHAPKCGTEQLTTIDTREHATEKGQLTITRVMVTRNLRRRLLIIRSTA